MGYREIILLVIIIKSFKMWFRLFIIFFFCIKIFIYILDYIFYEIVRFIRVERIEIMRGKYFNKMCWVCIIFVIERKVFFIVMDYLFCF